MSTSKLSRRPRFRYVDVTPTCHAGAMIADNVLFQAQELANATNKNGGDSMLVAIILQDLDDVGDAIDLYFTQNNVKLASAGLNSAVNVSDANLSASIPLGHIATPAVAAGAIGDMVASRFSITKDVNIPVRSADDSRSIYVHARTQGTGTYTASGLKITFVFED